MTSGSDRIPLILDVDTGVDDALALALATRAESAELIATSTLAGNVDVTRATANTLAVLDWLGAADVPVHRGATRPLARSHVDAAEIHGENGIGGATLPTSERPAGRDRGPAAMIRLAFERPGELTLVCLGPLTNLAIALNVEPLLGRMLRRVVIMGGAFEVSGNITNQAEFNFYVDSEAAEQVFAADLPDVTVIGLDVTHKVALPRLVWEAAAEVEDRAAELVVQVCRRTYLERHVTGLYLHDPLALAVALDSSLVHCRTGRVEVTTTGDDRGKTRLGAGGPTKVAYNVESERFLGLFYRALNLPGIAVDQADLHGE